jgi:hypothetical protein
MKVDNHMDPRTLHIAFGDGALDFLIKQLRGEPAGDAVFTFPDYTIRFYPVVSRNNSTSNWPDVPH